MERWTINDAQICAELGFIEKNYHALHSELEQLKNETFAKFKRMRVRLLARLRKVESKLAAAGVPTPKS